MSDDRVVVLHRVTKRFGSNVAVREVDLSLCAGEVHALVGENGAGKSTLVNLITHQFAPTTGRVDVVGHPELASPAAAIGAGIAAVYQDRKLAPNLTGLENIFLRQEISRCGLLRGRSMRREAERLIERTLGLPATILDERLARLAVPEQEAIAVAKALLTKPRLLILDEPSDALSVRERERLYELVDALREDGLAVLYISHALNELRRIADRVTVLRDGAVAGRGLASELSKEDVIRLMVGRDVEASDPAPQLDADGEIALAVDRLTTRDARVRDVSFAVHRGEILGVVGLQGSGRRELLRAVVGLAPLASGSVTVGGEAVRRPTPRALWQSGVAFVPSDRHREGTLPHLTVAAQMSIASLPRVATAGIVRRRLEVRQASAIGGQLRLRAPSLVAPIERLSGGNQQKTVLGRALAADSKIWVLDDPTAAIDVGSRADLHGLMREFAQGGGAIVVASSDATELLPVCHRVLVMFEGRVVDELNRDRLSEAELVRSQYGVDDLRETRKEG